MTPSAAIRADARTQSAIARACGVSRSLVSAWARGVAHPSPSNLAALEDVLGRRLDPAPAPQGRPPSDETLNARAVAQTAELLARHTIAEAADRSPDDAEVIDAAREALAGALEPLTVDDLRTMAQKMK